MTIKHLKEILQLEEKHFDSLFEYQINVVAIFEDKDPELLYDNDVDYIQDVFTQNFGDFNFPKTGNEVIQIDGTYYEDWKMKHFSNYLYKLPLEQLTLGAYIDLEEYCKQPKDIDKVLMILYRKNIQKDTMSPVEYEKYENWFKEREKYFNKLDAKEVVGAKTEFLAFRDNLLKAYSGLFEQISEVEENTEGLSKKEIREIERAKKEENSRKQFAWENTILNLCNNDITKFMEVLELPVILVFNVLSTIKKYN